MLQKNIATLCSYTIQCTGGAHIILLTPLRDSNSSIKMWCCLSLHHPPRQTDRHQTSVFLHRCTFTRHTKQNIISNCIKAHWKSVCVWGEIRIEIHFPHSLFKTCFILQYFTWFYLYVKLLMFITEPFDILPWQSVAKRI